MKEKPVNMAASVRQRLMNLRATKGGDYNALLTQFAIERFLYRLSKSDLSKRFVLKGAMLFRVWAEDLYRPTKDLDLLGSGDATPDAIANAVRMIVTTPVEDDGLVFDTKSITAGDIREDEEYRGVRVKLLARLASARIDVGFGDAVTPRPTTKAFPTLLDFEAPKLRMYPPETVIAEKLQIIVKRGIANSRMKDYYDHFVIFRIHTIENELLAKAIATTFARRKTDIPETIPTGLTSAFCHDPVVIRRWTQFLRRQRITDVPNDLEAVVATYRARLVAAMSRARHFE